MPQYAKGLVLPPNLNQLQANSWRRYGAALNRLPRCSAPSWDSRTLGIVPAIKNQSSCGSCWDFSGTGVVETTLMNAGVLTVNQILSEQYTLDCYQNGGCNGDDNSTVMEHAKTTGLPLTADYGPYQGGPGRCQSQGKKLWKITDWGYVGPTSGVPDVQAMKDAIAKYKILGVAIAADDAFMNNPKGAVFAGSGSQEIDHDVILLGWNDAKGVPGNPTTLHLNPGLSVRATTGAWLLRNSWGLSWCDDGYCWILYGANLVGYAALWGFTPPVPPVPHVCPPGMVWNPATTQCEPFLPPPDPLLKP